MLIQPVENLPCLRNSLLLGLCQPSPRPHRIRLAGRANRPHPASVELSRGKATFCRAFIPLQGLIRALFDTTARLMNFAKIVLCVGITLVSGQSIETHGARGVDRPALAAGKEVGIKRLGARSPLAGGLAQPFSGARKILACGAELAEASTSYPLLGCRMPSQCGTFHLPPCLRGRGLKQALCPVPRRSGQLTGN